MPEETQVSEPNPLPVTVIGVRTEGTGDAIKNGDTIITPGQKPNLKFRVIRPIAVILAKGAHMFLTSVVGVLTTAMVPSDNPVSQALRAMDFYHLMLTAASIAVAPTVYELLKNMVTVLGDFVKKNPLLTGNV